MVSRQQRMARERQAAKAQARFEAAQKRRREQRIAGILIAVGLVVLAVIAGILIANANNDEPDVQPDPTAQPTASTDVPQFASAPPPEDAEGRTWTATLTTSVGDIELELDGAAAPQAVSSFLMLAREGFFEGSSCHRLLPDSLLQCGDPTGTGRGGPGYTFGPIENPPSDEIYPAGTLAMARVGLDGESMGSQFFLVFGDVVLPDDAAGGYTVFGTVTQGLDILQSVGAAGTTTGTSDGPPATAVTIEKVTIS